MVTEQVFFNLLKALGLRARIYTNDVPKLSFRIKELKDRVQEERRGRGNL